MKSVVIIQSNYLPWKGYFDLINDADEFIFYDDLQYTKNDWRNRNKIKTKNGSEWITVPVGSSKNRLICEVDVDNPIWQKKHWNTIQQLYSKAPHFANYKPFFEDVYRGQQWTNLSVMNQFLIESISKMFLNITTEFNDSRKYDIAGQKLDRLLNLVTKTKAERYISGPAAKDYIEAARFAELGVELVWKDYSGYPEYPQRFPPFEHSVSILDLLFNVGPDSPWYIWGWRESESKSK